MATYSLPIALFQIDTEKSQLEVQNFIFNRFDLI